MLACPPGAGSNGATAIQRSVYATDGPSLRAGAPPYGSGIAYDSIGSAYVHHSRVYRAYRRSNSQSLQVLRRDDLQRIGSTTTRQVPSANNLLYSQHLRT